MLTCILALPTELLEIVGNYRDFLYARADFDVRDYLKAMVSLHAMSHINKTRQRIIKNNEALADKALTVERETRDQGFTRPKVLILLPFRNSALPWMHYLTHFSLATQVENNSRFQKDFNLPDRAIDKLAMDEKDAEGRSKYPKDHRETFKGNIDDTFRVGLKVTRKSIKLYTDFYHSDLIIASPLGLRASIETQKSGMRSMISGREAIAKIYAGAPTSYHLSKSSLQTSWMSCKCKIGNMCR